MNVEYELLRADRYYSKDSSKNSMEYRLSASIVCTLVHYRAKPENLNSIPAKFLLPSMTRMTTLPKHLCLASIANAFFEE